jgi:hypothetical protein
MRYEDFHASEPELALTVPAVVILDKRKARFAIVEKVETAERFAEIIDQVMGGEMESHAKIRLPNLFPRLVDPPPDVEIYFSLFGKGRWLWIVAALLVAGVIIWAISRIPDAKLD